jgi:hypothetical protein
MLVVFAFSIFLSAALLFVAEPMVARFILPGFGGSPSVWNTAMVFYQGVLLLGYGYAHLLGRHLAPGKQILVHALVVVVAALGLPPALPEGWAPDPAGDPALGVLAVLALVIGPAFFAVSTTGPLLQRWFSRTDHASARDPYFLYAASNAGSIVGLLGYPVLVEPLLSLGGQSRAWALSYGLLALGLLVCGLFLLLRSRGAEVDSRRQNLFRDADAASGAPSPNPHLQGANSGSSPPLPYLRAAHDGSVACCEEARVDAPRGPALPLSRGLLYLLLAFVPSSLTLGVTSYISTDVASVPMLWVVPLTLYLASFVAAFSRLGPTLARRIPPLLPFLVVGLACSFQVDPGVHLSWVLPAQLLGLLLLSTGWHAVLAENRPPTEHLTAFYLWISVGGALGGVFNALIAPILFDDFLEYPLMLAVGAAGLSAFTSRGRSLSSRALVLRSLLQGAGVGALLLALLRGVTWAMRADPSRFPTFAPLLVVALFSLPLLLPWFRRNPLRLGLPLAALLLSVSSGKWMEDVEVWARVRTFFGRHTVVAWQGGSWRGLRHGLTVHGMQGSGDYERPPTTYFHPRGPIGHVFRALEGDPRLDDVAVVGLGVGSLAAYAGPGQRLLFLEIDPEVMRLAMDPRYFTYLAQAAERKVDLRFVLGDGRIGLQGLEEGRFGMLIVDAFSSDAVPVHLATLESFRVYLSRLQERGILAFHISNNHIDLKPVVAGAARELGLSAWWWFDAIRDDLEEAKQPSEWVVMARRASDLAPILAELDPQGQPIWAPITSTGREIRWTDDHAGLWSVIKW